jgi:hypothetical protein
MIIFDSTFWSRSAFLDLDSVVVLRLRFRIHWTYYLNELCFGSSVDTLSFC